MKTTESQKIEVKRKRYGKPDVMRVREKKDLLEYLHCLLYTRDFTISRYRWRLAELWEYASFPLPSFNSHKLIERSCMVRIILLVSKPWTSRAVKAHRAA